MSQNCCGAECQFNLKGAKKQLKKYKKSGAGKVTGKLLDFFGNDLKEKTLLDIGGGIGAIQWHFLNHGSSQTTEVDYSDGYIEVAKSYAAENNWLGKANFVQGDFLEVADAMEGHDFVSLDKVVCCYPDYKGLLNEALSKCNHTVGLVYPQDGYFSKFFNLLSEVYFKLTGSPFRTYIHPVESVRQYISDQGFEIKHRSTNFPWHIETYSRITWNN